MGTSINSVDLTGRRFGRFLVIRKCERYGYDWSPIWECRCDCGTVKEVIGRDLTTGNTASCGCLRRDEVSRRRIKPAGQANAHCVYVQYRNRARLKELEFAISEEDFKRLTAMNCTYCGAVPSACRYRKTLNGSFTFNGLDRLDSSLGYTIKNVVTCCKACNRAKQQMTESAFRSWVRRVYNHWASK